MHQPRDDTGQVSVIPGNERSANNAGTDVGNSEESRSSLAHEDQVYPAILDMEGARARSSRSRTQSPSAQRAQDSPHAEAAGAPKTSFSTRKGSGKKATKRAASKSISPIEAAHAFADRILDSTTVAQCSNAHDYNLMSLVDGETTVAMAPAFTPRSDGSSPNHSAHTPAHRSQTERAHADSPHAVTADEAEPVGLSAGGWEPADEGVGGRGMAACGLAADTAAWKDAHEELVEAGEQARRDSAESKAQDKAPCVGEIGSGREDTLAGWRAALDKGTGEEGRVDGGELLGSKAETESPDILARKDAQIESLKRLVQEKDAEIARLREAAVETSAALLASRDRAATPAAVAGNLPANHLHFQVGVAVAGQTRGGPVSASLPTVAGRLPAPPGVAEVDVTASSGGFIPADDVRCDSRAALVWRPVVGLVYLAAMTPVYVATMATVIVAMAAAGLGICGECVALLPPEPCVRTPRRPRILFDGAAWGFPFALGATQHLLGAYDLSGSAEVFGVSAGNLAAIFFMLNTDPWEAARVYYPEFRQTILCSPWANPLMGYCGRLGSVRCLLEKMVPEDFHTRVSGRYHIVVNSWPAMQIR